MTDASDPDNDFFERHFHGRAELAEELQQRGFSVDANIVAATALDALAEVWLHDFQGERTAMEQELGGKVPPSIRMARFVKRFAVGAPHVGKVAVVLFAEDWKKYVSTAANEVDGLLAPRRPRLPGELPHAHLDITADDLLLECPALSAKPLAVALIEEYEYPALLYRFVRSPFVHFGTSSRRTHGFTRGEEVLYMPLAQGTTLGISVGVVTAWLRAAATGYVAYCNQRRVRPATNIEPAQQAEGALEARWKRVASAVTP